MKVCTFYSLVFSSVLFSSCGEKTTKEKFDFIAKPVVVEKREVKPLSIGESAPDFNLPGSDGRYYSLSDFDDSDVLAIIFTCNHCPTAQAYEERIKTLVNDYKNQKVQVIGISPNSPLGLLYEELGYSDLGDEFFEMEIRARDHNFNFPYLYDGDDQKVSLKYGPAATPHCFVFDKERKLSYVGRIDKSEKPGTANAEDLRNAIDALLTGGEVTLATTKTFGCSTKWGWKTEMRERVDKEWGNKEVKLEGLSKEGLVELMQNKHSGKLRLVNFWATWCAPCRLEYPEFVVIQRMFGARDFEFVSVSMDKRERKEKALDFLSKSESALQNYISAVNDKYALIELVDTEWNGALPYTALIEPDGKKVWTHQGEVDFLELKRAIVGHEMIGRVY